MSVTVQWLSVLYSAVVGARPWPSSTPLLLAPGRLLVVDGDDVWEVTVRRVPREDRPREADYVA